MKEAEEQPAAVAVQSITAPDNARPPNEPVPDLTVQVHEGKVPSGRPQRKIAITGTTPSRVVCPWHDPSWEKWTIGPGGSDKADMPWDALFELHRADTWPVPDFMGYITMLSQVPATARTAPDGRIIPRRVFTFRHMGWPANIVYPKLEMQARWGKKWFTSQVPWAIALAIEEGATDIGIYGVDMESTEEYIAQLDGCRHFMDIARNAFGINLHVPAECGLLRDPSPYPDRWETQFAKMVLSKINRLEAEMTNESQDIRNRERRLDQMTGERNAFAYVRERYIYNGGHLD